MDEFDRQVIAAGMERVRAEIKALRQNGPLAAQFPSGNIFPPQTDLKENNLPYGKFREYFLLIRYNIPVR